MTANARLRIEVLEARDCPTTVNLFDGVLTVVGTSGNDNITINRSADKASISVAGHTFAFNAITRVVVSGGNGDDVVTDNSDKSTVIYGGNGNDKLYGGVGKDKLYGGQGNDYIDGGRGDDVIYGGNGSDNLIGGAGTNTVKAGSPTATITNSPMETQIIQLVNSFRASNGLAPLAVSGLLNVAATLHSQDMAAIGGIFGPTVGMQHELFGTTRPEVTDRLDAAGYDTWTTSFAWGENIAYGYTSATAVMNAWMNSPEHRANLLNPTFTQIGVSVHQAANGTYYFTQDFGFQA